MVAALAGVNFYKIVTPATADQGDTIDCSSIFPNEILMGLAQNATDGSLGIATAGTTSITLPSGGTDNEARTISVIGY